MVHISWSREMLSCPWCFLAGRAAFQRFWLLWGCSGVFWSWLDDVNYWWDTCSFLVSPQSTFASSEWTDGLRSALRPDVACAYFQDTAQAGFLSASSASWLALWYLCGCAGTSGGPEGCTFLNCFICLNTPFLRVRLWGTVSFCSVLKNKILFCVRERIYYNDKSGYSQKKERYALYILYRSISSPLSLFTSHCESLIFPV